ncbi:MAG TPA: aconitate hydratase AcnA [Gammaproteobacteria bacterium]|nr:aconitate hydratase AcnA [Gammaproteobacteria bacterium]
MKDSFKSRATLSVGGKNYEIFRLDALEKKYQVSRLPYSLKVLLEMLLRLEDGVSVKAADIEALASWDPKAEPSKEIAFTPARVLMQDFTGVPAVVDLAAMRDAMKNLGGNPEKINPLAPAELIIDHSVQVDFFASPDALARNAEMEFQRNQERYSFLKWGQQSFENFKVVPPDTGICHQVNLEYLSRVVFEREVNGKLQAYPDTLVGTDSHTTMVNGLGVLGWGVGGIEAEAAMLGQPSTMLIPQVVGVRLSGKLSEGATATDLVLTIAELLRKTGVVGKFVEYFGPGVPNLPLANRATLGNMSPEFGSTCAICPIDAETLSYLKLTGRSHERIQLVETYAKAQGLWHEPGEKPAEYSQIVELDLASIEPSIAGPKRPQDRIPLKTAKETVGKYAAKLAAERAQRLQDEARFEDEGGTVSQKAHPVITPGASAVSMDGNSFTLRDGAAVIAAITSCTNTSNPEVMIGAGLLARRARALGLKPQPWVKTSLAPGSKVVTDYLRKAGLLEDLAALGFALVGYGCTTCIGNSGPLRPEISQAIDAGDLSACAVLSGNRNFEGRIHPEVKMNFLASPPLVVAYAIAGSMIVDLAKDPLGTGKDGKAVYLKDIWPSQKEISDLIANNIESDMFTEVYDKVYAGDQHWNGMRVPEGEIYQWDEHSTYVRNPPYFDGMRMQPLTVADITGARVLALLGDSVTTDHISPAGSIKKNGPAGEYLIKHGVQPKDFNSYGSRRGNHEVMMRGTFANIRLRNLLAPGTEGGVTTYIPSGEVMSIYDASVKYQKDATPLLVIAGEEYGSGSSRDWAAKGTLLLGVKAVIARSFERIHRSNLIGMGVLPLQFHKGEDAKSLGLTGKEEYSIEGMDGANAREVTVKAKADDGKVTSFKVRVRLDTPKERDYYRNGGILQYVLRQLAA